MSFPPDEPLTITPQRSGWIVGYSFNGPLGAIGTVDLPFAMWVEAKKPIQLRLRGEFGGVQIVGVFLMQESDDPHARTLLAVMSPNRRKNGWPG